MCVYFIFTMYIFHPVYIPHIVSNNMCHSTNKNRYYQYDNTKTYVCKINIATMKLDDMYYTLFSFFIVNIYV